MKINNIEFEDVLVRDLAAGLGLDPRKVEIVIIGFLNGFYWSGVQMRQLLGITEEDLELHGAVIIRQIDFEEGNHIKAVEALKEIIIKRYMGASSTQ